MYVASEAEMEIAISNCIIRNEERVKFLGIHIDGDLKFNYHVNQFCEKASKKLNALARICISMDTRKRRTLTKAFITSQFSYCPLIWMLHSRNMEHKLNKIHRRAFQLVHEHFHDLTFEELLAKDDSVSIHKKNLQILASKFLSQKMECHLK